MKNDICKKCKYAIHPAIKFCTNCQSEYKPSKEEIEEKAIKAQVKLQNKLKQEKAKKAKALYTKKPHAKPKPKPKSKRSKVRL